MRVRPALAALAGLAAAGVQLAHAAAGDACSVAKPCADSDAPCCSAGGTCGAGAEQCAGGCQPLSSKSAGSCLPMPVCTNQNLSFQPSDYKNDAMFKPILHYTGDASTAPFTLDSGLLAAGPEGVVLALTAPSQAKISTTHYMLYGEVELEMRHDRGAGIVAAFITMSDDRDEIDWEFTTDDPQDLQTNFFVQAVRPTGGTVAANVNAPSSSFSVSDWHTYGFLWTADRLAWKIDGKVVRSINAKDYSGWPTTPSRVQISMWAGGNSTNPPGVIQWAGGPIDWTSGQYTSKGYYAAEIRSMNVTCGSPPASDVTSWVYTGANDTATGKPAFETSTKAISFLKDPSQDGAPGTPGSGVQVGDKVDGTWNGKGSSSSSSGSWFTKDHTLKILVPAIAGAVALIAIWAIVVRCMRRRRNSRAADSSLSNIAVSEGGLKGAGGLVGGGAARYQALPNADKEVPMGAQRYGAGLGPAPGPRPDGRGAHFADASSESLEMAQQKRPHSPAVSQYSYRADGYANGGFTPAPPQWRTPAPQHGWPQYGPAQTPPPQQQYGYAPGQYAQPQYQNRGGPPPHGPYAPQGYRPGPY